MHLLTCKPSRISSASCQVTCCNCNCLPTCLLLELPPKAAAQQEAQLDLVSHLGSTCNLDLNLWSFTSPSLWFFKTIQQLKLNLVRANPALLKFYNDWGTPSTPGIYLCHDISSTSSLSIQIIIIKRCLLQTSNISLSLILSHFKTVAKCWSQSTSLS